MNRLAVALFVTCLASPVLADSWAIDQVTGCTVWNDENDSSQVTVIWTGDCVEGKASAQGVLTWLEDGKLIGRYTGNMSEGKLGGEGVLEVVSAGNDGFDRFEATFSDGQANGPGVFFGANGSYFQGEFANGVRTGYGELVDPDGNIYTGYFSEGSPDGFGRLVEASGGVYVGYFAHAAPTGPGTFTAPDGTIYQGVFKGQFPDGDVLVTSPSGEQVVQHWKDGEKVE